ncbi:MAG: alanine racemase, partial [Gemmatimonas sp.]
MPGRTAALDDLDADAVGALLGGGLGTALLARLERLARLPSHVRLAVAADDVQALDALAVAARLGQRTIDVLVEADLGMHRVGVTAPGKAVAMARHIDRASSLRFAGLQFYPG